MASPFPTQSRSPEPGDVIAGKYIVERVIGRGGMGAVYEVTHRFTRKRLAMKCLLPEHLSDQETIERFVRESQAAGRIQHRHVADIFDVGRDGSVLYMLMPLLEGKPLSQLFKERCLSTDDVLVIMMRALEGVAAAHAQGVLHRDLKPDNIFVCLGASGRIDDPRVLDFGISKFEDDVSQPLTRSGISMGTPYYMSLEQISGSRDLDQRVDVYAMGVLLYEGLSGERPYTADTVGGLAVNMVTCPATPLHERRPELPRALCEVVMRAISVERADRTPTIAALMEGLKPFVLDAELAVLQGTNSRSTPPPATQQERPEALATARIEVGTDATLPLPALPQRSTPVDYVEDTNAGSKRIVRFGLLGAGVLVFVVGLLSALSHFSKTNEPPQTTVVVPSPPPPLPRPVEPEPVVEQMKVEPVAAPEVVTPEIVAPEVAAPEAAPEVAPPEIVDQNQMAPMEAGGSPLAVDAEKPPRVRRRVRAPELSEAPSNVSAGLQTGQPTQTVPAANDAVPPSPSAGPAPIEDTKPASPTEVSPPAVTPSAEPAPAP